MDNIHLDTHYTRSIHLERDVNSIDILSAYIPTSRAMQTLANIADTFNTQSMQRAWSLIGSYGSGKSSFAAFLAHLLENPQLETHGIAKALLQKHNPDFANNLCFHDNGYCIVLLTGSPESLSKRFIAALHQAASNYLPPDTVVCQKLAQAKQTNLTTTEIIDLLKQVQQAVINQAGQGILIVIDELGKFLEYEARHQGTNDIFLLQAIAEHAYQGSTANILLVVLMHQAFEQYAKGLSDRLKNEWLKVQGRFENISFLESAEQTLRVMAAAFRNQLPEQQKQQIAQQTTSCVAVLAQQNALYTGLSVENATDILTSCYPLHPIAALILPILCQKVAQNERTLFSYLGSQEAFGFKHSLERVQFDNWVLPWEIFQYFIENQPLATTDHITHRRWAEVMTALERLGDAEELEVQLLKTIGLFNIIGSQAGFKASNELLALCFKQTIETCLIQLQKKSIINYRKFNSEYRIWQGSDFDLTLALQETKQQLGYFNLAQTLERRNKLQPILARKYSIQKTMIRYFQPHYADSETSVEFFKNTNQPRIIFFWQKTKMTQKSLKNLRK
jgi:ABC-type dipeptide/oligopeptide/nickel transport system ATPase component